MQSYPEHRIRNKNTFIEIVDEGSDFSSSNSCLLRSSSDSNLSSLTQSSEFLEWATTQASNGGSDSNTPCRQHEKSSSLDREPSQKHRVSIVTMELCGKLTAISQQQSRNEGGALGTEDVIDPATLQEVWQRLCESLTHLIPVDAQGKKLTVGSILHSHKNCKPCYFFAKGRCTLGESCLRCHCPDHRPNKILRDHAANRRQKFSQQEDQDTSIGYQPGSAKADSDDPVSSNARWDASLTIWADVPGEEVQKMPSMEALDFYQRVASLSAQGKQVPRRMVRSDDITKHVPLDSEGNVTSIGTIPHYLNPLGEQCKPCVFWFQQVCRKGESCLHCHTLHDGQRIKKMRASKSTRALRNDRLLWDQVWV